MVLKRDEIREALSDLPEGRRYFHAVEYLLYP